MVTEIWIIEDDRGFADEFAEYLRGYAFVVRHFDALSCALERLHNGETPDLITLDQFLGRQDSLTELVKLRSVYCGPCIIVSGNCKAEDRVVALELGADDYVSKQVPPREQVARIRAVLRRASPLTPAAPLPAENVASRGTQQAWQLDPRIMDVTGPDGARLHLTATQYRVLDLLSRNVGQVVSRDEISCHITGRPTNPLSRNIDTLLSQIRNKMREISAIGGPPTIRAIRGSGYMFTGFQKHD